jgi:hypothetical protein
VGNSATNRTLTEKEKERILLRNAAWYRRTGPKVRNQAGTMVLMKNQQAIQHAIRQRWNSYLQPGAETPLGRYGSEPGWAYTYDPNIYNATSQTPAADSTVRGQEDARNRMAEMHNMAGLQLGGAERGTFERDARQANRNR